MIKKILKFLLKSFYIFPIKGNRISFICYRGTQYSCNPKYMAEYFNNVYPEQYEVIFFYTNDNVKNLIPHSSIKTYKFNSIAYIYSLLTSKYIISNITIPTFLPYRQNQIKLGTWHGATFKGYSNPENYPFDIFDIMIAENKLTEKTIKNSKVFNFHNRIITYGMPRNDILIKHNKEKIDLIKAGLKINKDVCILLYAPTWRDSGVSDCFDINFKELTNKLHDKFGGNWIVATRYHHLQINRNISNDCIDLSDYPDMQELMLISDILITDYSSCMWDYSLTKRPCFLYASDIKRYVEEERGDFLFPLKKLPFPICESFDELIRNIDSFNNALYQKKLCEYYQLNGIVNLDGTATKKTIEFLLGYTK